MNSGLSRVQIEDEFRTLSVHDGYVPVADLSTEFDDHIAKIFLLNNNNINNRKNNNDFDEIDYLDEMDGITETKRVSFDITINTTTANTNNNQQIKILLILYSEERNNTKKDDKDTIFYLRCFTNETLIRLPLTTVGQTIYININKIKHLYVSAQNMFQWYISGIKITKKEILSVLSIDNGSEGIQLFLLKHIIQHSIAVNYPISSIRKKRFLNDVIKIMWNDFSRQSLNDELLLIYQQYVVEGKEDDNHTSKTLECSNDGSKVDSSLLPPPSPASNTASPSSLVWEEVPPIEPMDTLLGDDCYWRSFPMLPFNSTNTCTTANNSTITPLPTAMRDEYTHVRCRDTFGGVSGTSIKVWPSGIVLGQWLAMNQKEYYNQNMIEFGCGKHFFFFLHWYTMTPLST